MSDYTIRLAQPDEYQAAGRLTLDAYAHDGMDHADSGYDQVLLDAATRAEQADLLVAVRDDGTVVGTVTFCRSGSGLAELARHGEAEFRMLAVAPEVRGAGIGEALVRACLGQARAHGDTSVVLSTQPGMAGAHRVYERLGFRRLPERDWTPVPGVDLLAYRLDL